MKKHSAANVLLIELLTVILFFMLGSVILIQVFGKSHELSVRSRIEIDALNDAQNVADSLYAARDPEECLTRLGFTGTGEAGAQGTGAEEAASGETGTGEEREWLLIKEDYTVRVRCSTLPAGSGTLLQMEVACVREDKGEEKELIVLPCSKYTA